MNLVTSVPHTVQNLESSVDGCKPSTNLRGNDSHSSDSPPSESQIDSDKIGEDLLYSVRNYPTG